MSQATRCPIITPPYLLLVGEVSTRSFAKTAAGLRDWAPELCVGQLRFPGGVDLDLPDLTLKEAVAAGARTLVIGAAPVGGRLSQRWISTIVEALKAGLDVASGLHQRLAEEIPEVARTANDYGRRIHDVRVPPENLPVGTGRKRSGKRLLTVGTDCACGKKYTALALTREFDRNGVPVTFRATGQTGIMISGSGIPIDAVVSDFIAGAAEMLSPDAASGHWDVIEGQGSVFHPGYAGVTVGLVHGSQPDAMVLCHDASRTEIEDTPGFPLPPIDDAVDLYQRFARLTNPKARVAGLSLNTNGLTESAANRRIEEFEQRLGLPCVDPMRTGVERIVRALLE